jgi:hypothetical protein
MENKIRFHRSKTDPNGDHREYVVYEDDGKFVFDCFEWGTPIHGTNAGVRKQHLERATVEEAIKEYKHYIATWENEVVD